MTDDLIEPSTVVVDDPPPNRRAPSAVDIEQLRLEATRARWRARAIWGLAILAIAAAVLVPSISTLVQVSNGNENGRQISALVTQVDALTKTVADLTHQLSAARDLLDANAEQDDIVAQCERKLTAATRAASRDTTIGMARLVVVITTTPIVDRQAAALAQVAELQRAIGAYDEATDMINAWQRLPIVQQRTDPCPV